MFPSVHGSTSVDWEWGNGARIVAKSLAPIHIHLSGQDVGSVASLQNTRGREGGRGGRKGGRKGGRNGTDIQRVHVSVSPMSCVCLCV